MFPNLFVVGAQKAGTTSLHAALKKHPDIFMSEPKEPAYFIPDHGRPPDVYGSSRGDKECLAVYQQLFSDAQGFKYVGEASTHYSMMPKFESSASKIHALVPEAKIIYLMRDPVERTISHYWWNCQNYNEDRSPLRAIADDDQYCGFSYYAMQIRPYIELFSPQNVFALTTEELLQSPGEQMAKLFQWLGLDPNAGRADSVPRENMTPQTVVQSRSRAIGQFRRSKVYRSFMNMIPKPVRVLAARLSEKQVVRSDTDLTDVKAYLRPIQRIQAAELSELLGREFPEWKSLYADCIACHTG